MSAIASAAWQPSALHLVVGAGALLALSGVPGLLLGRRSLWGQRLANLLTVAACGAGLAGAFWMLAVPRQTTLELPSPFPGMRTLLGGDALSAWFAVPVFLVGGLGSIFGSAYWSAGRRPRNGRRLRLCYGWLLASLVFVLLARDGASFLIAWEVMALTNFFLVTIEENNAEVRRAGWLYLLYSHVTILGLFAFFMLQHQVTGALGFQPIAASVPTGARTAIFALALVAFGVKAGAMPLHSWLPSAHASAPSHVSAVMSGVVIKMGIYGLVRTTGLFDELPLAWGATVLALGAIAAFFGVVFALAQHDLKRLLAYHSIENIGIILLGLGLAMVGRSVGRADWVLLGMAGCLFHVWNHALFKSLLFFGAGSVVHATGSRDIERLGGLARRMPATATLFLVGALAICGLPPWNGFASELLVYLGLVRAAVATPGAPSAAWVAVAAPVLAATGALAVACFVKVTGIVFLGTPRSAAAGEAHESPLPMLLPMALLAALCALLGLAPVLVAPALERATAVWAGGAAEGGGPALPALAALVPFSGLSLGAVLLVALVGLLVAAVVPVCRRGRLRQPELPTWDCGFAAVASSPRVQYTGSSFAGWITSSFAWALRPHERLPQIDRLFPAAARFDSHVEDTVLDRFLQPAGRCALAGTAWFRSLPQGQLQRYIVYILAVLVPLLMWAVAGGAALP